jgi:xanthine dehydrogenase accessory factor
MAQFYQQMATALAEGEPFALGVISDIKGSSPQKKGAKALFFADGRIVGTLGGGCLEAEIQDRARRALLTRQPATFDLVLDHDFGWDDGLICGGKVCGLILPRAAESAEIWRELARRDRPRTWGVAKDFSIAWLDDDTGAEWLYQETVLPPCALWMAGSGHVAQAVAPIAAQVDFEVTVFDDRPALANDRFFPGDTRFRVGAWEKLLEETSPPRPCFGLVVTRGHQRDALVLARWIRQPFAFLGMIGSRRKARLIFDQFVDEKIATREQIARVACPVGLDIDSRTVPEIAVSIVAQLIQERARNAVIGESVFSESVMGAPGSPHRRTQINSPTTTH